jgi:glutamyl endopeptidase
MQLKSVNKPRALSFEAALASAPIQPREILSASAGEAPSESSRAANQFLVRGTRDEPLNKPSRNVFESLLGDVDRRKQILETDLLPWRMLCSLDIVAQNGLGYVGTGWFAGPRTVITAGHCVYDPIELGGWARQITVMPGRNGDSTSLGTADSSRFSTTDRWIEAQDADYDYAAIHLNEELGTAVGSFGIGTLPDGELQNRLLNISGYPVSPGNGKFQYFHANRVKAVTARRVFYDIDTMGGQSGSPVWTYLDDDSSSPVVVGIHAYGLGGVPAGLNVHANSGPRILPEVLEVIRGWIQNGE